MSLNPLTWPLAGKLAAVAVVAALAAFLVVSHGSNSANGSGGLTWTCTTDGYGNVTVVFTSHASSDIEVYTYDILFYDQSGNETGSDLFGGPVVPADQEYIEHHYVLASNVGGGTMCKVAAVDSGPMP
jgi:hypothetical protein